MLHELLGIKNNRIKVKAKDGVSKKEYAVAGSKDEFFRQNQFANFGELATNVKEFIDKVASEKKDSLKIDSLEDMQNALESIPKL